jgi:hypothetical protein
MACRVGNQVDALRGLPGGKQLGHVGMGTLADDTDLIVQRREDVFVRFDAQWRTFVDLPQGGNIFGVERKATNGKRSEGAGCGVIAVATT